MGPPGAAAAAGLSSAAGDVASGDTNKTQTIARMLTSAGLTGAGTFAGGLAGGVAGAVAPSLYNKANPSVNRGIGKVRDVIAKLLSKPDLARVGLNTIKRTKLGPVSAALAAAGTIAGNATGAFATAKGTAKTLNNPDTYKDSPMFNAVLGQNTTIDQKLGEWIRSKSASTKKADTGAAIAGLIPGIGPAMHIDAIAKRFNPEHKSGIHSGDGALAGIASLFGAGVGGALGSALGKGRLKIPGALLGSSLAYSTLYDAINRDMDQQGMDAALPAALPAGA